jgi:aminoglycoside N3'-acetyltransferase
MADGAVAASPTRADIEAGLRRLGLRPGDIVEVHSSLSRFGHVQGGAGTVVDALMAVVGREGTLVMSAFPVSKSLPVSDEERAMGIRAIVRLFGEEYTGPTGMGVIADEFRSRPDTVLGRGIHRVCAWGHEAPVYAARGYDYLRERDGYALLLGVDIHCCSSMHGAEAAGLPPPEVEACWEAPDDIRRRYPADVSIHYGATPKDGWGWVQDEAERRGLVIRGTIGCAECLLFRARAVVDIYARALRTDPYGLFGVRKATPA